MVFFNSVCHSGCAGRSQTQTNPSRITEESGSGTCGRVGKRTGLGASLASATSDGAKASEAVGGSLRRRYVHDLEIVPLLFLPAPLRCSPRCLRISSLFLPSHPFVLSLAYPLAALLRRPANFIFFSNSQVRNFADFRLLETSKSALLRQRRLRRLQ